MPYYRRARRSFRGRRKPTAQRRYKKRGRSYSRTRFTNVSKSLALRPKWSKAFPQKGFYKLIYTDAGYSFTLNVGNGYSSSHVFNGNDLYDPDVTGVGNQPYGFDELSAFFQRFLVYSSKIDVWFHPADDTNEPIMAGVVAAFNASVAVDDYSDLSQFPHHKMIKLTGRTGDNKANHVSLYASSKQICNTGRFRDASENGSTTASPSVLWRWTVFCNSNTIADDKVIDFDVKITYYAMLTAGTIQPNES